MNGLKYNSILYFIALVILATLCIQVYWNFKNYQTGKQQLLNDVQTSLDNAVDNYYTQLASQAPFGFMEDRVLLADSAVTRRISIDTFQTWPRDSFAFFKDSMPEGLQVFSTDSTNSLDISLTLVDSSSTFDVDHPIFEFISKSENPIRELSSKIIVSVADDSFWLPTVDSLFAEELQRKNIAIDYGLSHSHFLNKLETLRPEIIEKATLETTSKSPFFFRNNSLKAHFTNVTLAILKRNLLGILLSFVLVGSVVFCLVYLLRIIQHQKQLAEVKNDLISNITHEFKTPIATIGIAMEAIENFNASQDAEKNVRYAKISRAQVDRLNTMVEKLLETATLDSEKLELNRTPHDLVELLEKAASKEAMSLGEKTISFSSSETHAAYAIDIFHFENAINNIIDNAIKYGGDQIDVHLSQRDGSIHIAIKDSGASLTETQRKQIFEKFYRVPKGNTHDVKGFGIGLYYSKKIVEKHGGTLTVDIKPTTQFNILLPHG
ncbi:MAG: HAMP domain-containing sensor histidine kinase [Bacteroidota bacterium]